VGILFSSEKEKIDLDILISNQGLELMRKRRKTSPQPHPDSGDSRPSAHSLIPDISDRELANISARGRVVRMLPDVHMIKIGGQSIMDRGGAAVHPLVREIVRLRRRHKIIIGTGGGTRSRHAYSIAIDLGMPTGVIAKLGTSVSKQNARMLYMLLAEHGGIFVENVEMLPLYLDAGNIPIVVGMPPYDYWEAPARESRIPECRTDSGIYLLAETLGAKSMIFVKDEDGLYTADPKKDKSAKYIKKISLEELLKLNLDDLIVERKVLEFMRAAKHIRRIQIVNGLKPGNLTRALHGEETGSVIYKNV